MRRPLQILVLSALSIGSSFAWSVKLNCEESGCLQGLKDKVAGLDLESYKDDVVDRVSSMNIQKYKAKVMKTVARPIAKLSQPAESNIPPVCRSTTFKNYRNFLDDRKFDKRTGPSKSKTDCCILCQIVGDCFSFSYDPAKSQCNYYVSTEKVGEEDSESKTCPSGVGNGHLEYPNYPMWPGHHGHEVGPCLSKDSAALAQTMHGIDMQSWKDATDKSILDLTIWKELEDDEEMEQMEL